MKSPQAQEKGFILVIDDDPLLTRTLKKLLEKEGYSVDIAHDGPEGIKKAKSGFFHLVLSDIRMPGLDGLMTVQHIQDFQKKAGIGHSGFIMITAYDTPQSRAHAFQLGVTDFILKPFDAKKFLAAIDHHIAPLVRKTPPQTIKELNERLERLIGI